MTASKLPDSYGLLYLSFEPKKVEKTCFHNFNNLVSDLVVQILPTSKFEINSRNQFQYKIWVSGQDDGLLAYEVFKNAALNNFGKLKCRTTENPLTLNFAQGPDCFLKRYSSDSES